MARKFFDGSVLNSPLSLATRRLDGGSVELRLNAVRGLHYRLLASPTAAGPFTEVGGPPQTAFDTPLLSTNTAAGAQQFFRASVSLAP